MKPLITVLLLFIGATSIAQVKGNKAIETRTFEIKNIETIKINFYAKVTIDQSLEEGMTITTDNNLFDLIDKEVVDNTLYLDQKEWIQPSQDATILIGAPNLRKVETGTHDMTKIINVDSESLQIIAPVGNIMISGKTKELRLGVELSEIDALKLEAENAYINIWSWGKAKVNVNNLLDAEVSNGGRLIYDKMPLRLKKKVRKEGRITSANDAQKLRYPDAKYISFKIKNNSANRNQFKVVGPKPDGSKFGYGFPMMPFATRKEKWTVGTKVYKVNALGFQKLLVTITKQDANKTVKLF